MRTVDLLFFMGQSNMAGRGEAALAPVVAPGMGYEYRAVTDPDTLHPLEEPFGVNENDPAGVYEPGMKTGAMVSSFVNACTAQTGVPVVGVSCAKGGSAIAKWLPGTPYYQDAVRRARKARAFLQANGYIIRHSAMVWCQGCTDGDLHTPKDVYKADTERVLHSFMQDAGAQTCFLIQIGNQRDEPELYLPIQQAQEELTAVLRQAVETAEELGMEIDFTSPGWLPEETLRSLGLHLIPSCGACLSNMAVTPGGQVVPCQSWLGGTTLGNLLTDDWSAIWDGETCRAIRAKSAKLEHICQLGEGNREGC